MDSKNGKATADINEIGRNSKEKFFWAENPDINGLQIL